MTERQQRPRQRDDAPGPLDDPFADPFDDAGEVDEPVIVGTNLYHEPLPVARLSVGEIRRRMQTRLDIDPRSTAVLDGDPVGDESMRVQAGQVLTFVRGGGEKGGGDTLHVAGDRVEARSPEGTTASLDVPAFVRLLAPPRMSTEDLVLPDGVRLVRSAGRATVIAWELPPRVHRVRWIAPDSPAPFRRAGAKVKYTDRRLAMPYIVIFAVFVEQGGRLALAPCNEAYFRTAPIKSLDDELFFPALLNISHYGEAVADEHPLSWVCTQYVDFGRLAAVADLNTRVRRSLDELKRTVLDTGFNLSSEHHEDGSYWTMSARSIEQVADLDRWERLSREDPTFVLDVPWLPATWRDRPLTVRALLERIFALRGAAPGRPPSGADLARLVLNHGAPAAQETAA